MLKSVVQKVFLNRIYFSILSGLSAKFTLFLFYVFILRMRGDAYDWVIFVYIYLHMYVCYISLFLKIK